MWPSEKIEPFRVCTSVSGINDFGDFPQSSAWTESKRSPSASDLVSMVQKHVSLGVHKLAEFKEATQ